MTRQELEKAIHFRTINVPCCGNCKRFNRDFSDTWCNHPQNVIGQQPLEGMDDNDVCDRFERREENQ